MPISWWHVRTRIIIGVATFFDAFDALAIAFVLPVLVPAWNLNGPQIGFLIAAGYLGQLAGALFFGWIAERYGRLTAVVWSILIFAVMSFACAFTWDYQSLDHRTDHPGFWPGRRGAGRRDLYQRAVPRQGPRPFRSVVRIDFSRRPGFDRPGRRLRRAALRLAMHVRDRRTAGFRRLVPAAAPAGIAALVGDAGTAERGASGARLDRARNGKIHRPAIAGAASPSSTAKARRRRGPICSARSICAARWWSG